MAIPCLASVSLIRIQLGKRSTPPASRKTVSRGIVESYCVRQDSWSTTHGRSPSSYLRRKIDRTRRTVLFLPLISLVIGKRDSNILDKLGLDRIGSRIRCPRCQ